MPFVSVVAAITAVEGAPVNLASLFTVVPVVPALAISNRVAFAVPRSRFPPSAPESVGVEMVGLVARTTLPVPVVALPPGVPVKDGLESDGEEIVGLVARTTLPLPVVALPPGVPVKEGLESVAEEIVGVVMVGLVARTTLPLPVVALPPGVPVNEGLESVGEEIVGVVMVGLVARTTLPLPVVALPPGVPVKEGLESVGEEIVGVVMVGLVAKTTAPVPVVPLDRSSAAAGVPTFSLGNMLIARGVALTPFVESTNPRICAEVGLALPGAWQSPAVVELIDT